VAFCGLVRRKECWVLTIRGWIVFFSSSIGIAVFFVLSIHPFLALTAPVDGEILTVEGWLPEYALKEAIAEFEKGNYRYLIVTGGPIPHGSYLARYKTFPELGAAILLQLGFAKDKLKVVPAPEVVRDRTFASAVALKKWIKESGDLVRSIDIVSLGPHARRTWILFKKAFDPDMKIGIISVNSRDYDSTRWWKYSSGVRNIINETVAYIYARFFFDPA